MLSCNADLQQRSNFEIKQDGKFFTKLMSKETSMAIPSFRVSAAGSVPFVWESQPGTPKHILIDTTPLPPLTPPPAYHYFESGDRKPSIKTFSRSNILSTFFRRINSKRMKNVLPASPPALPWSSSSSSMSSMETPPKHKRRDHFSASGSSFDIGTASDDDEAVKSSASSMCFAISRGHSCSRCT